MSGITKWYPAMDSISALGTMGSQSVPPAPVAVLVKHPRSQPALTEFDSRLELRQLRRTLPPPAERRPSLYTRPTSSPDRRMLREPIWCTWARHKTAVAQSDVESLANDVTRLGFPASQIEIDDRYTINYGDLAWDPIKFPNPAEMTAKLKYIGHRVTTWIVPFFNKNTSAYDEAAAAGYLLIERVNDNNNRSADILWWQGVGGQLDPTNPSAVSWFANRLARFRQQFGIESFKFDAGEVYYLRGARTQAPLEAPMQFTTAYVQQVAAKFGGAVEVRAGYRTHAGCYRMFDKDSHWGGRNGLRSIVPNALMLSMAGYHFVMPDMIGGNAYSEDSMEGARPERELYIRWMQLSSFLPIVQFSIAPWDYDQEVTDIALKTLKLRAEVYIPALEAALTQLFSTGEPVTRPLWWASDGTVDDVRLWTVDDQFLVGDSLLVAPVIRQSSVARDILLPSGRWKDGYSGRLVDGPLLLKDHPAKLDMVPHFIRTANYGEFLSAAFINKALNALEYGDAEAVQGEDAVSQLHWDDASGMLLVIHHLQWRHPVQADIEDAVDNKAHDVEADKPSLRVVGRRPAEDVQQTDSEVYNVDPSTANNLDSNESVGTILELGIGAVQTDDQVTWRQADYHEWHGVIGFVGRWKPDASQIANHWHSLLAGDRFAGLHLIEEAFSFVAKLQRDAGAAGAVAARRLKNKLEVGCTKNSGVKCATISSARTSTTVMSRKPDSTLARRLLMAAPAAEAAFRLSCDTDRSPPPPLPPALPASPEASAKSSGSSAYRNANPSPFQNRTRTRLPESDEAGSNKDFTREAASSWLNLCSASMKSGSQMRQRRLSTNQMIAQHPFGGFNPLPDVGQPIRRTAGQISSSWWASIRRSGELAQQLLIRKGAASLLEDKKRLDASHLLLLSRGRATLFMAAAASAPASEGQQGAQTSNKAPFPAASSRVPQRAQAGAEAAPLPILLSQGGRRAQHGRHFVFKRCLASSYAQSWKVRDAGTQTNIIESNAQAASVAIERHDAFVAVDAASDDVENEFGVSPTPF
uniref:Family 10 glycosylhydrolase n=1 Tax=Macrostomum lignano TaxID=282301 RepID=A0A1I8HTF2_9PLAT